MRSNVRAILNYFTGGLLYMGMNDLYATFWEHRVLLRLITYLPVTGRSQSIAGFRLKPSGGSARSNGGWIHVPLYYRGGLRSE